MSTSATRNTEGEIVQLNSNDFGLSLFFGEAPPVEEYSTTYRCFSNGATTNGDEYQGDEITIWVDETSSRRVEQIIEFDYDIVLTNGSNVTLELKGFQERLLNYVGSELMEFGCGVRRQRKQRALQGKLMRRSLVFIDGEVKLNEVSSEPEDVLLGNGESATCDEENIPSPTDGTECYPVTGYLTAYYTSSTFDDTSSKDQVEIGIHEIVERGMAADALASDIVRRVHYVVRGETEEQQLEQPTEFNSAFDQADGTTSSNIFVIGMMIAGAVAVAIVAFTLFKRSRRTPDEELVNGPADEACTVNEIRATDEIGEINEAPHSLESYRNDVELYPACSVDSDEETEVVSNVRTTRSNIPLSGLAEQAIAEGDDDGDY